MLKTTSKTIQEQAEIVDETTNQPIVYLYATIDANSLNPQIQQNVCNSRLYIDKYDMCTQEINEFQRLIMEEISKIEQERNNTEPTQTENEDNANTEPQPVEQPIETPIENNN